MAHAVGFLNDMLDTIRFTGRCIHLGWIVAQNPTERKPLRVSVDPGIAFSLWDTVHPYDNEKQKKIGKIQMRFKRIVSRAVKDSLKNAYSESLRPNPLVNVETAWDWAVSGTIEDLIAANLPNIKGVCVGCPFMNSNGIKSAMLYALFDASIGGNLPDVMRTGAMLQDAHFESLCAHNHTSFQQAVIYFWLNEVTKACLNDAQFKPSDLRVGNVVQGSFFSDVAALLMADHVEQVSSWGWTRVAGGSTREGRYMPLFDWCIRMSHQRHEGQSLIGSVCISNGKDFKKEFDLAKPVKTKYERAIGKLILASETDCYPIIMHDETQSFGCYMADATEVSDKCRYGAVIEFRGSGTFRWRYRGKTVMDVINGTPFVSSGITEVTFAEQFRLRFDSLNYREAWKIIQCVSENNHGAMIIITAEAESEAARIADGFATVPFHPRDSLWDKISTIDGGLLIRPEGSLYAFGFFLDGSAARGIGDISRGARFNSAKKYAHSFYGSRPNGKGLLIAVVSQDGMVDLIPNEEDSIAARPV